MVFGSTFHPLPELDRIDGEQMEFEWKIFPRFTTLGILDEIQKTMISEFKCEPEHFKGRTIIMSMYNDTLIGENEETEKLYCES